MATASQIAARSCAVTGTVLTGLPIVAPVVLAAALAITAGGVRLDWLMPGELFLLVLVGDILLVIAAVVLRRHIALVSIPAAITVLMFGATALISEATGLASGRTEPSGWPLLLLLVAYGTYVAAVVAVLIAGIILSRTAFARAPHPTHAVEGGQS